MKINLTPTKPVRIEMLPLIDIVFLLLVFFIYAMLSMAVHRGLPVVLPVSETARIDKKQIVHITVKRDGSVYVDKQPVDLAALAGYLRHHAGQQATKGALLFGDRDLSYQALFRVLDQIRMAGITNVSLQAESERAP